VPLVESGGWADGKGDGMGFGGGRLTTGIEAGGRGMEDVMYSRQVNLSFLSSILLTISPASRCDRANAKDYIES